MRLPFGYEIGIKGGALVVGRQKAVSGLSSVYTSGWYNYPWAGAVLEANTGYWQRNIVVAPTQTLLSFSPVYACVTGIASDIAKMRIKLTRNIGENVWKEVTQNQPWLPLLRNPNHYQDHIKFIEAWMLSKLLYGNTYVLKERQDLRGIVTRLYILHPNCVKPLVAPDGSVYYEINRDELSGVEHQYIVPASEIIHDRMAPLWHPLIGVSPLYACGTSATMGNSIQSNSTKFFQNRSIPGGMLSGPGTITQATADRLKAAFESGFSGENIGKTFVAGDGLKFEPFSIDAQKMQQIEQLGWTVNDVARAFRYPAWKLGGPQPPYTKPDQAETMYFSECLQPHVESIEACLDNGLELPLGLGTEFDLDGLLRMDRAALYESINAAGKWMKLDEQRNAANLPPLEVGGNTIYRQEQDHSIEAIAEIDKRILEGADDAGMNPEPESPQEPEEDMPMDDMDGEEKNYDAETLEILFGAGIRKAVKEIRAH